MGQTKPAGSNGTHLLAERPAGGDAEAAAALARCVGDPNAFRSHWGRRPMLRRGAGPFGDLLDLDDVETVLDATARRPGLRLVRDGSPIPVARYTTTTRFGGASVEGVADPAKVVALVADGATVVLQGLQRTWPPLIRFARALERATSHAVQVNAYLSPPTSTGLARHADGHDVLVLQVSGTKAWAVDGLGEIRLAAGDVLYLPTGTPHAASAEAAPSLHLTVGLLRTTGRDVLRRLVDSLGPELDEPLPLGYARAEHRDELRAHLAHLLGRSADAISSADLDAVAEREALRARRRRRPAIRGQLRAVLGLADLHPATRIRWRADQAATLAADAQAAAGEERIVLSTGQRTLRLPAFARPALEAVLAGDEVVVEDLPGLDGSGRLVLARRLVREHLAEVVAPGSTPDHGEPGR